jgi:DNA polymerase III delta prime subunit
MYGTGKTTLANLLPGLLESAKAHPDPSSMDANALVDNQAPNSQYFACMQGQNGLTLIQGIQSATSFVAWNSSGLHYVILDEVDLLTDAAMTSFKSVMNRKNVVFIMTTNHLDQIDPGIQNRSVLVDMNQPPAANWRPLLRRVYTDASLTPPSDATLDQVVQAGRGSARTIFNDVVMSANQARRQGQQQVAKVSNIRS